MSDTVLDPTVNMTDTVPALWNLVRGNIKQNIARME